MQDKLSKAMDRASNKTSGASKKAILPQKMQERGVRRK
jgi:hypothetical protein